MPKGADARRGSRLRLTGSQDSVPVQVVQYRREGKGLFPFLQNPQKPDHPVVDGSLGADFLLHPAVLGVIGKGKFLRRNLKLLPDIAAKGRHGRLMGLLKGKERIVNIKKDCFYHVVSSLNRLHGRLYPVMTGKASLPAIVDSYKAVFKKRGNKTFLGENLDILRFFPMKR